MDARMSKKNSGDGDGGRPASATHKALITANIILAFEEEKAKPVPQEWLDLINQIKDPNKDGQS